jgi:hypothetical protein
MFHDTFGYYADGVDAHIATLPDGWEGRLVPIRGPGTAGNTGWALEVHDLLISKYVANREKDRLYTRAALRHGLADVETLRTRLASTSVADNVRARIAACIRADLAG